MSSLKQDSPSSNGVKKLEDDNPDAGGKDDKRDIKPVKTLNRVPRACNACRKQKMRCEGADNPPCRRCRHANLECLFEKPSREPTLTGEAGLERIRSLEAQVSDIRHSQTAIHNTLSELVHHLRNVAPSIPPPSNVFPAPFRQSPMYSSGSPQTPSSAGPIMVDPALNLQAPPAGTPDLVTANSFAAGHGQMVPLLTPAQPGSRQQRGSASGVPYRSPSLSGTGPRPSMDMHPPQLPPPNGAYPNHMYAHGPTLPPISSIQEIGHRPGPSNVSSVRYHPADGMTSPRLGGKHPTLASPGRHSPKRKAPTSSNVTSSNTSDVEEDDNGELPASGLVAPWEVLRGLADVAAAERANQENGDHSEPHSRGRSLSPDGQRHRSAKRRKMQHRQAPRGLTFMDVVSKNIVSEQDARELFKIFYAGCSTFLPVFDYNYDTYESLHERSPFAFNCICMVAAKVRDGGGPQSEIAKQCLEEVQSISCATLFAPVSRQEAVQAMILVSGWSDNGWLSGGHAVRMAVELSMHLAWPKLLKRIRAGKASKSAEDRKLVTAARTWFCLYLFEHQMSYGNGRPAILKDDESIYDSRMLLQHPLATDDDMRLCSTVELMAIRERVHNKLLPVDRPVDDQMFAVLREADVEFKNWFATWDSAFSRKYEDAAFYRQSLQIQQLLVELFHNATALRGIDGPEDVLRMHPIQRDLALSSLQIAQKALSICINSNSYREGLKYAVHYTHATATFSASFLLRLGRLFPEHCDMQHIRSLVESLAEVLSKIPARRYAFTLQLMLKKSKKRRTGASRSPTVTRQSASQAGSVGSQEQQQTNVSHVMQQQDPISPLYERQQPAYVQRDVMQSVQMQQSHAQHMGSMPQFNTDAANLDQIWRGFEGATNEQLPVWLSDQSLGGASFSQLGLEAFMMPIEYDQHHRSHAPQIW